MKSAAMKWMLLKTVFIGKDKTKWGEATSSTHTQYRWKNTVTKVLGITGQQWKPLHPMKHGSLMMDEILNKIVQPQKWCQTERQN